MNFTRSSIALAIVLMVALGGLPTVCAQLSDSLLWQGQSRTFTVYVPSDYSSTRRYPLILALHPGLSNAAQHAESAQWHVLGEQEKFITVYPNGTRSTPASNTRLWNAYNQPSTVAQVDDVGFLNALLNHLIRRYAIDTCRVYSSGFSNGAMMTYRMACDATQRFAAIAPLSGGWGYGADGFCGDGNCNGDPAGSCGWNMANVNCRPSKRLPVIFMKGSLEGDNLPTCRGTTDSLNKLYWRTFLNCRQVRIDTVSRSNERVIREIYTSCQDGTEFQFLSVIGNSHQWHSPATTMFWEFLKRFSSCAAQQATSVHGGHHDRRFTDATNNVLTNAFVLSPNPASDLVSVRFRLEKAERVWLKLFNALGQEVAQILDETLPAGEHEKALDIRWWSLPQGTYFLRAQTPTFFQQQLLQVMR